MHLVKANFFNKRSSVINSINSFSALTSQYLSPGFLEMAKRLAAFDFDNTIVNTNSDVVAISLIEPSQIPESTKKLYGKDGWTAYMQGIFKVLHANNITQDTITKHIRKMKPMKGFCELIHELKDDMNYDIIIISDANSYFINEWLHEMKLNKYISEVFTNPAKFIDEVLNIKMYHFQDSCKLSTKNLCKGMVLEDFIKKQKDKGVYYEKIIYVGDGSNDFCPILKLRPHDVACVRENFKCAEMVQNALDGKYCEEDGAPYVVKADVCIWKDGNDILNFLKK